MLLITNDNNITILARASRSDPPSQEAEWHHHDKTYLHFIDAVLEQFKERFSATVEKAAKCFALVVLFLKKRKSVVTDHIVVS